MEPSDIKNVPIPVLEMPKIKDISLHRIIEGMVPLQDLHDSRIVYEPIYHSLNIEGATEDCFFRQNVGKRLIVAAGYLPEGYKLKIFDAWRPPEAQTALYSKCRNQIRHLNPTDSEDEIDIKTKKIIPYPQKDNLFPYAHGTGGSLDVTVVDNFGKELNMGTDYLRTAFDSFDNDLTQTAYYEMRECTQLKDLLYQCNRRILYNSMIAAGFTNLPSKWWHYDFGNYFWAYYVKNVALYGMFKK